MIKELFLFLLSFLNTEKSFAFEYVLPVESSPLNIYWISENNILISYRNKAEIVNLENRARNTLEECTNCIYGYDGEIVRCEYVHREIESSEEFSTTIYVYNSKEEIVFQKDLFPTVLPTLCKKDFLLLKSAYSFLEQKSYYLDTTDGLLSEYNIQEKNRSVGERYLILIGEGNFLKIYLKQSEKLHIRPYQ